MTALVLVELAYALVGGLVSIVFYSFRSQWRTPVGRMVLAWMVVGTAEAGSLLALAVWHLPVWVFAVVFGALDAVVTWRQIELWKSQREG